MTAKSIFIKGTGCKSDGCALKAVILITGGLLLVPESGLREERSSLTKQQKSAAGEVVHVVGEESRGEAPKVPGQESETPTAKRMNESPANNDEQLMEVVCECENCLQALKRVKSNKGSVGIDGMRVEKLPGYLKEHWPAIREQLLSGAYKPQPVKREAYRSRTEAG